MSTSTPVSTPCDVHDLLGEFLAGYWSERTRANYAFILTGWFTWCTQHRHAPVAEADPAVLEAWIAELRARGYAPNTIAARVSAVSAFYRWCVRERLVARNPVEVIRRPARPGESSTVSLTRHELTDWPAAAERHGGDWWAAAMLLGLNGLRCGELIACDVTDVGSHSWHHTLALRTTKGDKPTVIALAPPTMQALAGRSSGPLLRNASGRRMTAYNLQYLVTALARDAGSAKHVTPHGLRHSAITIGLDAGVSLRDMQDFARHADPKPPAATTGRGMPSTATPPTPSPTTSPGGREPADWQEPHHLRGREPPRHARRVLSVW